MNQESGVKPVGEGINLEPGKPLWKSVNADLLRRVERDEFRSGFPGELALTEEYGVSRGTIRAALRPLREGGFISAERGRNPRVVAGTSRAFGPVYSLLATLREAGMEHRSQVLKQDVARDASAAFRLELEPAAELFHLARIRYGDAAPLALDEVWLPAAVARPLLEVDFTHTALYRELDQVCGIILDGGTEQLSAVAATEEQAMALGCDAGTPMLFIERVGYAVDRPLEFRRSFILGDRLSVTTSFGRLEGRS